MNSAAQKTPATDPLERIRAILLGDDEEKIALLEREVARLREQLHDKDRLIETIDPILADLIDRKIHESREEMAEALAPIMGEAIKKQVEESKEEVVDALYPVIGSMISRAVAEAMRKIVENINENLNRAFDLKVLWHKIRAKIFGVSAAEVALAEGAAFKLEELFLIERTSGMLIAYASRDGDRPDADPQVIGSMLAAIKQFAEDVFQDHQQGELREIEYGDRTVRIEAGKFTYLAAVYSGVPPADLDVELHRYHHKIHNRFYRHLKEYRGDHSVFLGAEKILANLIRRYSRV